MTFSLEEIGQDFQIPIISIVYDKNSELENEDKILIYNSLNNLKGDEAIILLNNEQGGDFFAAFNIALFLYEKFKKNLSFIVPEMCASAATLPLLLGKEILMSKQSFLTQCDCYFVDEDVQPYLFRANKSLQHPSERIRLKSKKYYDNSVRVLKQFFRTKNSIIAHALPKNPRAVESFILRVIDVLERKENHEDKITSKKLKEIGFNIREIEKDSEQWKKIIYYTNSVKERLSKNSKRFAIETSEGVIEFG